MRRAIDSAAIAVVQVAGAPEDAVSDVVPGRPTEPVHDRVAGEQQISSGQRHVRRRPGAVYEPSTIGVKVSKHQ